MALLRLASAEYNYDINLADVAKIWRAGCIIRAALLSDIRNAFSRNPALANLMVDGNFAQALASAQQALREVVQLRRPRGFPSPRSARRSHTTTRTAARDCRRILPRGSAITLAHTPIAASTVTAFFTPSGHTHERRAADSFARRPRLSLAGCARAPARFGCVSLSQGGLAGRPCGGGEFNTAANLADCFGMRTGVASAMVDYPVGELINERVRAMGVRPFYKRFKHDGARGPNMAAVYSDRGHGVRAPVVFYNRSHEAAALLKPGDFAWKRSLRGRAVFQRVFSPLRNNRGAHLEAMQPKSCRRCRSFESELSRKTIARVRRQARSLT